MNGEMNQQVNSEVLRYLEVKESKRLTSQRPESFTNMKHRIFQKSKSNKIKFLIHKYGRSQLEIEIMFKIQTGKTQRRPKLTKLKYACSREISTRDPKGFGVSWTLLVKLNEFKS